jgi:monoamine oxidase
VGSGKDVGNSTGRGNELQTMTQWTRRSLLAAATALAAQPALGQRRAPASRREEPAADVDVIIVGAGAAGIAAARRLSAAGRSFTLVEATARVGGRCITDTASFGVPFDRGAHWIHTPATNPLLATPTGLEIYPAPAGLRVRIGRRFAREGELEDYLATIVRANRAIAEAARGRTDVDCRSALPRDLGEWRHTAEFALGPYGAARDLEAMSAQDLSRSVERDTGAFCRQGYGALLAKFAAGIPVELNTPVTAVEFGGRGGLVLATTPKGRLTGRYMIVTASTEVLAEERIRFVDGLPGRFGEAIGKLRLGSFDHIALELPDNPLGLRRDDLVFEKSSGPRTAALLANVSGTSLSMVEVGGRFGRDLVAGGERAAVEFAVEWLAGVFGTDVKGALRRTQVTNWNAAPWTRGALATAAPGGQWARKAMMEPVRNRMFFAGEAVHETLWGTVAGAWESGERAANAVLRRIAGLPDAEPPKPAPSTAEQRRQERRNELERRRQERRLELERRRRERQAR